MSYKLSIVKNKMMKRIINILILLCCIASLSSCGNSTEERSRVLKIYNWADYIDEDVLAEFPDWYKQQTGEDLRIIYQVFDINEIMLTKIERGHEDFDVVCPSEYIIERMLRKDLLLPIDRNFGHTPDYIPNVSPYIRHELNKTSQPERQTEDYAVPYMWGTAGILFNKKFITAEEAGTWDILWDSKNRGKILMKDSYRDAYGTAIIYAHARELADSTVTVEQLMNDNSPEAIALAEQYLKDLKPNIAGWEADFGKEMMTKNKAWLNLTWSGDAVWAIEEAEAVGVDLDYVVPREGSNIWYDGWAIPKYARNVKAASYFINYLCQPDIALRNMDAIGYVSAVATPEIMEACFSGGVMEQCEGIPGMLFITAANGDETSKADVFNGEMKVWMSNRFTSTFIEQITDNKEVAMRDLYYRLFINTVGSHVMVYNAENYGNLYSANMSEFINFKNDKSK